MKIRFLTSALLFISMVCGSSAFSETIDSKVIDEGGSGPFKAIAAQESTLPDYTIYRPENLTAAVEQAGPLPLLVFATGACKDSSFIHERLLSEVASHGYLILAIGALEHDRPTEVQDTDSEMLIDAIDWM